MRLMLIPAAMFLFAAAGCSGESFPETYPVTGTLTHNGKPVEGAAVTLVPADAAGRSASGVTDAEGAFSVATYFAPEHQPQGAISGDYTITVSKMEIAEIPEGLSVQEQQAAFAKAGPPKSLLPKAYLSPNTSKLKVSVQDASPEPLTIDLEG